MISHEYSALFLEDSIHKNILIYNDDGELLITNRELHQEAFEIEEKISDDNNLTFGSAFPNMIKFTVSNVFEPLKDTWITVKVAINSLENAFQIGRYKVYSDKPTADRKKREIVAYDALYDVLNADVTEWYNYILPRKTSTATLALFRKSFFANFGILEEDISLPNDNVVIRKTIEPEELSGRTVLKAILELNGCFGQIGRDGKFRYIFLEKLSQALYPSHDLYPSEELYPVKPNGATLGTGVYIPPCTYEDYVTDLITGVQIRKEDNDIGATAGTTTNAYVIQDNFLVYGKGSDEMRQIAERILNVIKDILLRPFSTKAKGNPCVEVGDAVRLNTKTQRIESYVLQRVLTGIQALRDTYEANVSKQVATKANSVSDQIIQLKAKTNTLTRTVDETRSELKNLENSTSTSFTQTSEKIEALASRTTETEEAVASVTLTASGLKTEVKNLSDDVSDLEGDVESNSSAINQNANSISAEVKRATEAEGELSGRIDLTPTSISLGVTNNGMTSGILITLKNKNGQEVSRSSGDIVITGAVSFEDLSGTGKTTVINGDYITTGTIDASRVTVKNLSIGEWEINSSGLYNDYYNSSFTPESFWIGNTEGRLYYSPNGGLTIESAPITIRTGELYLGADNIDVLSMLGNVDRRITTIENNLSDWDLEARVSKLERMVASVGLLNE